MLTVVIQMGAEFHVSVASSCDVEIPLYLVAFHAPVHPARIHVASYSRRLLELLPSPRRS